MPIKIYTLALINIFGKLSIFAFTVLLTSMLSVREYGEFTYINTLIILSVLFILFGLPQLITREIAKTDISNEITTTSSLAFFTLITIAITLAVLSIAFKTFCFFRCSEAKDLDPNLILTCVVVIIATVTNFLLQSYLRGKHRSVQSAVPTLIVQPVFFLIMLIIFQAYSGQLNINSAMHYLAVSHLIATAFFLSLTYKTIRNIKRESITTVSFTSWRASIFSFFLLGSINLILTKSDIILIGQILSMSDVAIYNIAIQLSLLALLPLTIINYYYEPMISKAHANGEAEYLHTIYNTIIRWTSSLTLSFIFIFVIIGKFLIFSVYGQQYTDAYYIAIALLIGTLANSLMGPSGSMLSMTGNERLTLVSSVVAATCNIILNIIFIQFYGILGAAYATSLSMIVFKLLCAYWVYTKLNVKPELLKAERSK